MFEVKVEKSDSKEAIGKTEFAYVRSESATAASLSTVAVPAAMSSSLKVYISAGVWSNRRLLGPKH